MVDAARGRGINRGVAASRGRGRGRGFVREDSNEPEEAEGAEEVDPKVATESLRRFANPQWWRISEQDVERQKRCKPDVFQALCVKKHGKMTHAYEKTMKQDSEQRWLRKVTSDGTAGDKVASLTMLIQLCPVLATKYIKTLLAMTGRTRADSMMAVDALKDLFANALLPERKLRTFAQMAPLAQGTMDEVSYTTYCVVTFFEDFLKTAFAAFVQILGDGAHNSVLFFKTKSIKTAYELLSKKPEQERALLSILVNKFGDSQPKVSSNVSFFLKKLLEAHPGMKSIVTKELEGFLHRRNITQKSKYFALLYLSEMVLSRSDKDLASQVIHVFVGFLETVLTGLERGPEKVTQKGKNSQKKRKFRRKGRSDDDNRIVRTLISGIHRALPYVDMASQGSPLQTETVNALFKICHTVTSFSTRILILTLLFRFVTQRDLADRFYRLLYEQIGHFELFSCAHRFQAFTLVQNCVQSDVSLSRSVAVGRRMLQMGANADPSVALAGLAVLQQLFVGHRTEVKRLLCPSESDVRPALEDNDDDALERFVDDDALEGLSEGAQNKVYQPLQREPRFAGAQHTPVWELYALARHVHPCVSHNASKLLQAETQKLSTNPFEEFSVAEMLEQFAYSTSEKRGKRGEKGVKRTPLNTPRFLKKRSVLPHERFFQLYFNDKVVQEQSKRKSKRRRLREDTVDEEGGRKEEDAGDADADEDAEDTFFAEHLESMVPGGGDEDEDEDEDFDADDMGSMEGDDDDNIDGADGEDELSDGGGDVDDADGGDSVAGSNTNEKVEASTPGRPKKLNRKDIKVLKKKHSGSIFASLDDFSHLLEDAS